MKRLIVVQDPPLPKPIPAHPTPVLFAARLAVEHYMSPPMLFSAWDADDADLQDLDRRERSLEIAINPDFVGEHRADYGQTHDAERPKPVFAKPVRHH